MFTQTPVNVIQPDHNKNASCPLENSDPITDKKFGLSLIGGK